jgi:predicted ATPase
MPRAAAVGLGTADWVAELERLVGRKTNSIGGTPDITQQQMFEQYTNVLRSLAAQRPLLLILDDLQWADAASISLLFHLGRRVAGSRILLVGTYRPDDVALGRGGERHPLELAVNELRRYGGDIWVDLDRTTEDEGRQFVDALLDSAPNRLGPEFRAALYQQTGGHPLFTVELLRGLQSRGDLIQDDQGFWVMGSRLDWETLPARVEGVIAERIGRLDEALREALAIASVEGEMFTAEVVARTQNVDVRGLVRRLSGELDRQHRLVLSQSTGRMGEHRLSTYRFRHILFQKYLYVRLSEGERAYLHEDIGTALELLAAGQTETIAAQLARHFEIAGCNAKAVTYLLQAGERARRLYANEEALVTLGRALTLLQTAPQDESQLHWQQHIAARYAVLLAREQVYGLQGEHAAPLGAWALAPGRLCRSAGAADGGARTGTGGRRTAGGAGCPALPGHRRIRPE